MSIQQTGALGEKLARNFLRQKGYAVLDANWSTLFGELDIVARQDEMLVFVEVKTRRSHDSESALAGISALKKERIIKAAYQYLQDKDVDDDSPWRIDVIAVALHADGPPQIDHVEDAFDW